MIFNYKVLEMAESHLNKLGAFAQESFGKVQFLFERRDSGYILKARWYFTSIKFWQLEFVAGEPKADVIPRISYNAEEKIIRTVAHSLNTSLENAEPAIGRYAGAIRYMPIVSGISGLAALDDHCLNIALRMRSGYLPTEIGWKFAGDHRERLGTFLSVL